MIVVEKRGDCEKAVSVDFANRRVRLDLKVNKAKIEIPPRVNVHRAKILHCELLPKTVGVAVRSSVNS